MKYICITILYLFQGGYPAKLKKVLIVTAPLWFKAPFKILRLFVREKLRDRVFTVSIPQLTLHIPRESLPHRLGGTLEIQHEAWLLHCLKSMTNRGGGELCEVSLLQYNIYILLYITLNQRFIVNTNFYIFRLPPEWVLLFHPQRKTKQQFTRIPMELRSVAQLVL